MRLEILDAREHVLVGESVENTAVSASLPAGVKVGVVTEDAATSIDVLTETVDMFVHPDTLRLVVVLAWPPDPITASSDETVPAEPTTTTTETSTTTTTEGGG